MLLFIFVAGSELVYGQKQIQAFPITTPLTVDGIHEPMVWEGAD